MGNVNKNKSVSLLNLMLLIINLTAFITISCNVLSTDKSLDIKHNVSSNEFLKDELKLSDDQFDELKELDRDLSVKYKKIVSLLCEQNYLMLSELSKESPSKKELDKIAKKTGYLNIALKKNTSRHFINIKKICNEEQNERLSEILKMMMDSDRKCKMCEKKNCKRRKR